jgi:hypothetical protein
LLASVAFGHRVVASSDSPSPHFVTASAGQQVTVHDVAVAYVSLSGPSAINLSDTSGRYMWVISQVRNNSDHAELVKPDFRLGENLPSGCSRSAAAVLGGQTTLSIAAGEGRTLVWRVRYECHSPAVAQLFAETVAVSVTHCSKETSLPGPVTQPTPGGVCPLNSQPPGYETDLTNNSVTASRHILVR